MENTKATLTGLDALQWLEARGGKFCRVEPWNAKTASPGKKPMGYGWQEKPLTVDQVKGHLAGGGNAGLLTGHHSGGICILDVDKDYSEFIQFFPALATAPTITREGADKGKIIIRIIDTLPGSAQFRPAGEDHPVIEFLADGRQGVAAGIHPSGTPYKLLNSESKIPELRACAIADIWYCWTGQRLQDYPGTTTGKNSNGDGLRAAVLAAWPTLEVFKHFGRAVETQKERQELRLLGNGGLLVRADSDAWYCHADQLGGGPFEAWQYCKTGKTTIGDFSGLLVDMAKAANIQIPERKNGSATTHPAEPEYQKEPPTEANGEPAADPWRAYTLADAFKERPPAIYAAGKIFRLPSLNIVYGAPGSFKSLLLQDLIFCVSSGLDWLTPAPWKGSAGRGIVTRHIPAVWIDFDNGSELTHNRFEALAKARGITTGDRSKLTYYSMPNPWLSATRPESIGMLQNRIKALGAQLVIIDNLGNVSGDADENSADMGAVMSQFRQIAEETRAAIVLIHHQRKSNGTITRAGDSLRGHSSIEAALDLALLVEREPYSETITIKATKVRGAEILPFGAQFTFTPKDDDELLEARFYGLEGDDNESDAAIKREILATLGELEEGAKLNKKALAGEVKKALDKIGLNRIRTMIDRMSAEGKIKTFPGEKNERLFSL